MFRNEVHDDKDFVLHNVVDASNEQHVTVVNLRPDLNRIKIEITKV